MFDDLGNWPPALATMALLIVGMKVVFGFLEKRAGNGALPATELATLNATLGAIGDTMRDQSKLLKTIAKESRDLWAWHEDTDPDTGLKRWQNPPGQARMIREIHAATKHE